MLTELLTEDRIFIVDKVVDWKDAILQTVSPLIADNTVNESYFDAIIENTHANGPYYVLAPGIAMPHARPETGVNRNGLAFLIARNGVAFPKENEPVKLIFLLAASDSEKHIELISELSELFCSDSDMDELFNAITLADVQNVLSRY